MPQTQYMTALLTHSSIMRPYGLTVSWRAQSAAPVVVVVIDTLKSKINQAVGGVLHQLGNVTWSCSAHSRTCHSLSAEDVLQCTVGSFQSTGTMNVESVQK
jgi:hypothetical protein